MVSKSDSFVLQGRAVLRRDLYIHLGVYSPQLQYVVSVCSLFVGKLKSLLLVSPPQVVGVANGVAQSIVSLARGFGPLLGGYV
jgi:hypothetical protein